MVHVINILKEFYDLKRKWNIEMTLYNRKTSNVFPNQRPRINFFSKTKRRRVKKKNIFSSFL